MKKVLSLVLLCSFLLTGSNFAAAQTLQPKPGEAVIKKSKSKSVMQVLAIDYNPQEQGTLDVKVYDSAGKLLAHQNEQVSKINDIATAVVYIGDSSQANEMVAVLNGAGFKNKQISYSN